MKTNAPFIDERGTNFSPFESLQFNCGTPVWASSITSPVGLSFRVSSMYILKNHRPADGNQRLFQIIFSCLGLEGHWWSRTRTSIIRFSKKKFRFRLTCPKDNNNDDDDNDDRTVVHLTPRNTLLAVWDIKGWKPAIEQFVSPPRPVIAMKRKLSDASSRATVR